MTDTPTPKIKICGIRTPDAMTAALEGGADFIGLVFVPTSPRYVEIEVAAYLANYVPAHVKIVGLFADAPMSQIEETLSHVRLDFLQLHGRETPKECAAIKTRFDRPIIKALSISHISEAASFVDICDWLLIDAPAPVGDAQTGGHGVAFDWSLLEGFSPAKPWMLAGGLTPDNVAAAIAQTHPDAVDVSSGVEITRGEKDIAKIHAFISAVKAA